MRNALLFCYALLTSTAFSQSLQVGDTLPHVDITDKGEITINNDTVNYIPWSSQGQFGNNLLFVQHMAGRLGVPEMNKNLSDAVVAKNIPAEQLSSIIIVNHDDSAFGSQWMIDSRTRNNKEKYPLAHFIGDADGIAAKTWQLPKKTATSIIVSNTGEILYLKHGETNEEDISKVLAIITEELAPTSQQSEVAADSEQPITAASES